MHRLFPKGAVVVALALSLAFAVVGFGDEKLLVFKAGETIYVCACGAGCDCKTISRKEGNCGCGNPLVKSTVTKVEGEKVFAPVKGVEQSFPTKAAYTCGCGPECKCGTISQKPGKCGCGKDLKKM